MSGFNERDHDMLIRLNEKFDALEQKTEETKKELRSDYVTKAEFTPVQRAVYAAIGFILTGFLGAVLTLVLKAH